MRAGTFCECTRSYLEHLDKSSFSVITLDQLLLGQIGIVLQEAGDDAISLRLMEMGVLEGTTVERVGQAPMGDPLEFAVSGYRLMLRRSEAQRVFVTVQP